MCPLDELFRAGVLVGEYILLSETTQVAGVVAVVDLEVSTSSSSDITLPPWSGSSLSSLRSATR
ncbi:hypothetical protein IscW_ISCW001459 [Ixodes scapularis]|uniref:Uncharacterized protein n=1 Tax=Ixodes scapularis TaxID=6945 RepID=B7P3Y1_IXOSC|nr:hypothetical protein IscW_ISCW001459 [Ixodes scapularis]|eukprot:XP_002404819.1 hypothetical protein IscW_ISCW001459 [Ixodes scapularis]